MTQLTAEEKRVLREALASKKNADTIIAKVNAAIDYADDVEAWVDDTDGSTITFDISAGRKHAVTLGDNRTLAVSNVSKGQSFAIRLLQDGTGSRTVTWFSTIRWAGGSAPTLTTTASKADWLGFVCTGVGTFDGFVIGQNL